jgi:hypothetical protein
MKHASSLAIAAAAALLSGCYVAPYYPYTVSPGGTTTVATPPSFDKSWDAALAAAADAGVQVTRADRESGRISGTKAGAAVTIDLRPQADKTLQVVFNAPGSTESNPTLNDRWLAAYNRRMGR